MADLLPHFKQDIEQMALVPADGGRFEFFVGDELVYSKLATGEFPSHREIVKLVEARMGR